MDENLALTDPKRWEDAEFEWNVKMFYFVSLKCFMGKPKNLHEAFQQLRAEVATKGYTVPAEAMALMEVELFKGKLLVEVMKTNTYDASILELERSKFFSAVHKGPFKTINQTAKQLQQSVLSNKGVKPTGTYYWDFRHGPEFKGARADTYVILCRV